MPIVGGLRFTYRLGTNEVTTEVAARMCGGCGQVDLRAREPDLIRRAEQASPRPGRRAMGTAVTPIDGRLPVALRTGANRVNNTWTYLLLFAAMSLTAVSALAQHKYYTRTVRRLARENNNPASVLVSGRGKGRIRGAIAVLVLDKQTEVIRAAAVMEGASVLARFKQRPDWVGLCARDDLPRCSPRLAKAVADARTHIPGRRSPAAMSGTSRPGTRSTSASWTGAS